MKNNIKLLRKQAGLRQEDLAAKLGVSRQTIIAIENDKYNPTLELAMKIAKFLNMYVEFPCGFCRDNILEAGIFNDKQRFLCKNGIKSKKYLSQTADNGYNR